MTNAHSETRQMAVCCQNLPVGAISSHSALSVLVGALFKKFGFFFNTLRIFEAIYKFTSGIVCAFFDSLFHRFA